MSDQAGDKRGLTIALILMFVIAAVAVLIFWLMIGGTSSADSQTTSTPGAAVTIRLIK